MWIEFQNMGWEDKKQGRSHSFHFLAEGNEHILAEWKTKGRHRGGGRLLRVCWKPRRSGNLQTPFHRRGRSLARPEGVNTRIPPPANSSIKHTICSLEVLCEGAEPSRLLVYIGKLVWLYEWSIFMSKQTQKGAGWSWIYTANVAGAKCDFN